MLAAPPMPEDLGAAPSYAPPPSSLTTSFVPEAMDNPIARELFQPQIQSDLEQNRMMAMSGYRNAGLQMRQQRLNDLEGQQAQRQQEMQAKQALADKNTAAEQDFLQKGIQYKQMKDGTVQAITDDKGNPVYKPINANDAVKNGVSYADDQGNDSSTGLTGWKPGGAYALTRDAQGKMMPIDPDAKAPVEPWQDDSGQPWVVRKNQFAGWEYTKAEDALKSPDPKLQMTGAKAHAQWAYGQASNAVDALQPQADAAKDAWDDTLSNWKDNNGKFDLADVQQRAASKPEPPKPTPGWFGTSPTVPQAVQETYQNAVKDQKGAAATLATYQAAQQSRQALAEARTKAATLKGMVNDPGAYLQSLRAQGQAFDPNFGGEKKNDSAGGLTPNTTLTGAQPTTPGGGTAGAISSSPGGPPGGTAQAPVNSLAQGGDSPVMTPEAFQARTAQLQQDVSAWQKESDALQAGRAKLDGKDPAAVDAFNAKLVDLQMRAQRMQNQGTALTAAGGAMDAKSRSDAQTAAVAAQVQPPQPAGTWGDYLKNMGTQTLGDFEGGAGTFVKSVGTAMDALKWASGGGGLIESGINAAVRPFAPGAVAKAEQTENEANLVTKLGSLMQNNAAGFKQATADPRYANDYVTNILGGTAEMAPTMISRPIMALQGYQQAADASAAKGDPSYVQKAKGVVGALTYAAAGTLAEHLPFLKQAMDNPVGAMDIVRQGAGKATSAVLAAIARQVPKVVTEGLGFNFGNEVSSGVNPYSTDPDEAAQNTAGAGQQVLSMLPFALFGGFAKWLSLHQTAAKIDAGLAQVNKARAMTLPDGTPARSPISRADYIGSLIKQGQAQQMAQTVGGIQKQFDAIDAQGLAPEATAEAKQAALAKLPEAMRPAVQAHLDNASEAQQALTAAGKQIYGMVPQGNPKLAGHTDAQLSAMLSGQAPASSHPGDPAPKFDPSITRGELEAEAARRQVKAAADAQFAQEAGKIQAAAADKAQRISAIATGPDGPAALTGLNRYNDTLPPGRSKADLATLQLASDVSPKTDGANPTQPHALTYLPVAHDVEALPNPDDKTFAQAALKAVNGRALSPQEEQLLVGSDDGHQRPVTGPDGLPFARKDGKRVILSDAGLDRLRSLVPRAREMLSTNGVPITSQHLAEAAAAKPAQAKMPAQVPEGEAGKKKPTQVVPQGTKAPKRVPHLAGLPDEAMAQRGQGLKARGEAIEKRRTELQAGRKELQTSLDAAKAAGAGTDHLQNAITAHETAMAQHEEIAKAHDQQAAEHEQEMAARKAQRQPPAAVAHTPRAEGDKIQFTEEGQTHEGEVTRVLPHGYEVVTTDDKLHFVPTAAVVEPTTGEHDAATTPNVVPAESEGGGSGGPAEAVGGDAKTGEAGPASKSEVPGLTKEQTAAHPEATAVVAKAWAKLKPLFKALGVDVDKAFVPAVHPEGTFGLAMNLNDLEHVQIDLARVAREIEANKSPEQAQASVEAALKQEARHIAQRKAFRTQRDFERAHEKSWHGLRPDQREEVERRYPAFRDPEIPDWQRGVEYVRMVLELEADDNMSEVAHMVTPDTRPVFQKLVDYLKSILKPGDKFTRDLVKSVQRVLDMHDPEKQEAIRQAAIKAEDKARKEAQEEAFGDRDSLLDAVRKSGGIPTDDPELRGELQNVKEGKNKGMMMRLFRKGAMSLDRLREALSEKGFHFETPAEMLDAILDSVRTGKEVYAGGALHASSLRPVPPDVHSTHERDDFTGQPSRIGRRVSQEGAPGARLPVSEPRGEAAVSDAAGGAGQGRAAEQGRAGSDANSRPGATDALGQKVSAQALLRNVDRRAYLKQVQHYHEIATNPATSPMVKMMAQEDRDQLLTDYAKAHGLPDSRTGAALHMAQSLMRGETGGHSLLAGSEGANVLMPEKGSVYKLYHGDKGKEGGLKIGALERYGKRQHLELDEKTPGVFTVIDRQGGRGAVNAIEKLPNGLYRLQRPIGGQRAYDSLEEAKDAVQQAHDLARGDSEHGRLAMRIENGKAKDIAGRLDALEQIPGHVPTEVHGTTEKNQATSKSPYLPHEGDARAVQEWESANPVARLDPGRSYADGINDAFKHDNYVAIGHDGKPYLLADVNAKNFRRDADGKAWLVDAVPRALTPAELEEHPELKEATEQAQGQKQRLDRKGIVYASALEKQPAPVRDGFYSHLDRVIDAKMPGKASADQVRAMMKGNGVKDDEIKWSGVDDYLRENPTATKADLQRFLKEEGGVKIQTHTLGNGPVPDRPSQDEIDRWHDLNDINPADRTPEEAAEARAIQQRWNASTNPQEFAGRTKYEQYQLPGGENYREQVFSLPKPAELAAAHKEERYNKRNDIIRRQSEMLNEAISKEPPDGHNYREQAARRKLENDPTWLALRQEKEDLSKQDQTEAERQQGYTSSHFSEVPNYLAHMRLNDRTDSEGKPGTLIEEMQSDRHQAGRDRGYAGENQVTELPPNYKVGRDASQAGTVWEHYVADEDGSRMAYGHTPEEATANGVRDIHNARAGNRVPDAPFRKTWHEFLFRKALGDAVASGKKWIGWTSGDTQSQRYDLSKQVKSLHYSPEDNALEAFDHQGNYIIGHDKRITPEQLPDYIGKEATKRLLDAPTTNGVHNLEGADLKIGGEGMKGFYDKIVPSYVAKYAKQWGVKPEMAKLSPPPWKVTSHSGVVDYFGSHSEAWKHLQDLEAIGDGGRIDANSMDAQMDDGFGDKKPNPDVWKLPINEAMRESIAKTGQPLFASATKRDTGTGDMFAPKEEAQGEGPRPGDRTFPNKEAALKVYNRLKALRDGGTKLNAGQSELMEQAERALRQKFIDGFDGNGQRKGMSSDGVAGREETPQTPQASAGKSGVSSIHDAFNPKNYRVRAGSFEKEYSNLGEAQNDAHDIALREKVPIVVERKINGDYFYHQQIHPDGFAEDLGEHSEPSQGQHPIPGRYLPALRSKLGKDLKSNPDGERTPSKTSPKVNFGKPETGLKHELTSEASDMFGAKPEGQQSLFAGSAATADKFSDEALGFGGAMKRAGNAAKKAVSGSEVVKLLRDAGSSIVKTWHPTSRGEAAGLAGRSIREQEAKVALKLVQRQKAYEAASAFFDRQTPAYKLDVIDRIENYRAHPDAETNAIIERLRADNAAERDATRALPNSHFKNFITDYFPHIWAPDSQAEVSKWLQKKIEGSTAFLKHRTIPTVAEALRIKDADGMSKFRLLTDNPVDMFLLRWHQMDKYRAGQEVLKEWKERGIAKPFDTEADAPMGWTQVDDRIGKSTVRIPIGEHEDQLPGLPAGEGKFKEVTQHYYAPEQAATVLNNHLSAGLRKKAVYQVINGLANVLNQAQLGLSAFHAGFTTLDVMNSRLALGLEQVMQGKPVEAFKSANPAALLATPFTNFSLGRKVRKEMLSPGTQGPDIQKIAEMAVTAGMRHSMDPMYANQAVKSWMKEFRRLGGGQNGFLGGTGNTLKTGAMHPLKSAFAALELASKPIMEHLVPIQKAGVFADLAKNELARLGPDASYDAVRKAMQEAADSVDNRMGQLVYDNLFWNKTAKDLAMITTRSVGWNLGSWRELGGSLGDWAKSGGKVLTGDRANAEFTHKMAYSLALPMLTGMIGATLNYLYTGEAPKEMRDYFFPKTGEIGPDGHNVRLALPTYMKDVYSFGHDPLQALANKANPLLTTMVQMLENKDFYGEPIVYPEDSALQKGASMLGFAAKSFTPFALEGYQKNRSEGVGIGKSLLPFIGLTPANKWIDKSPAEELASEISAAPGHSAPANSADAAQQQARGLLMKQLQDTDPMHGESPEDKLERGQRFRALLNQGVQDGTIARSDITKLLETIRRNPLQREFSSMTYREAVPVWKVASPTERKLLMPLLREKIAQARAKGEDVDDSLLQLSN
jgi:hypothetical protein